MALDRILHYGEPLRSEAEVAAERAAQEANHHALALRELPVADDLVRRLHALKSEAGRLSRDGGYLADAYGELSDNLSNAIHALATAINEIEEG